MIKNKPYTYILYALGEVTLVMVGILLALQVNTWNENRKNKKDELFYYSKLSENLRQDTSNIKVAISAIDNSLNSIDRIVEEFRIKDDEPLDEDISSTLVLVEEFAPEMSTWNNLIATGKISLITSQAVIDSLTNYYNQNLNVSKSWADGNREYSRSHIGPYLMAFDDIRLSFDETKGYRSPFETQRRSVSDYKEDVFIRNALVFKKTTFIGLKSKLLEDYDRAVRTLYILKEYEI